MHVTNRTRAAGRLAALAAVGLALAATTKSMNPCEVPVQAQRVTFAVASDCGPAGAVTVSQDGTGSDCPDGYRVQAAGAEAVGLPAAGKLVEPPPNDGPDSYDWTGTEWLWAGDFALAGPVTLPGSSPAVTVDRVCRFERGEGPALEMVCLGPAPEARCSGTLTPEVVR